MIPSIASMLLSIGLVASGSAQDAVGDSVASDLEELVVTAGSARERLERVSLGAERLELSAMKQLPSFFGENDMIKTLALLPGVRGEGEGGGGFEVRGGNSSQNRVLLDGMTLYNPAHVMGIFSTFNDFSTGQATLFKGPVPARFGGASSAVLETSLKSGDMQKWGGSASLGLLLAKAGASGPIVRDKISLAVGVRRSYADAFIAMIPQYKGTVMNFYDASARLRIIPSSAHIIDASFIIAHDNMAIKDVMGMYWGNLATSLSWFARASDKLSFTTQAAYTDYSPKMAQTFTGDDRTLRQYVRDASLRSDMQWSVNDFHTFQAGVEGSFLRVMSMEMDYPGGRQREVRSGASGALWANYDGSFGKFAFEVGGRLNYFSSIEGRRYHIFEAAAESFASTSAYHSFLPEPRVSLKYDVSEFHNVKVGFSMTSQYIHALRSSTTSMPFDRYILSGNDLMPERCRQIGAGYAGMTPSGSFDWSAELYWKSLSGVYDYADGMTMFSRVDPASIVLGGKGRSYGLELMCRKNHGRLTGWVAYTLSHTQSCIPGINDGHWYNATNDRRHDISVAAIYNLGKGWTLSADWIFSSGSPLTAPDVKYELSGVTVYYYSARNGYKTPPTHRLDISASWKQKHKHFSSEWNFGLYNVYCRYNPFIIYFTDDPESLSGSRAVLRALFGLLPSVSYTIHF